MTLTVFRRPAGVAVLLTCAAVAFPMPAAAAETIRYAYDARGRLIEVKREQPTVTVKTDYIFDKADNRTQKQVTTTP